MEEATRLTKDMAVRFCVDCLGMEPADRAEAEAAGYGWTDVDFYQSDECSEVSVMQKLEFDDGDICYCETTVLFDKGGLSSGDIALEIEDQARWDSYCEKNGVSW